MPTLPRTFGDLRVRFLVLWVSCCLMAVGTFRGEAQEEQGSPRGSEVSAPRVAMETRFGTIVVALDSQRAPGTTANFLRYVEAGLYDGATFYRTVTLDNQPDNDVLIEVIQGGLGPDDDERAFEPIAMESTLETGLLHLDGTLSMARDDPDSASSEFFICIGDQPELDRGGRRNPDGFGFAAFGRVVTGMDVVRAIHRSAKQEQRLVPAIEIRNARRMTR